MSTDITKWNQGLHILARQNPLTDDEWLALVEARHKLIVGHLKGITLTQLGDIVFFSVAGTCRLTNDPEVKVYSKPEHNFSLNTRGIFPVSDRNSLTPHMSHRDYSEGKMIGEYCHTWGLTRHGQWIGVKIHFVFTEEPHQTKNRIVKGVTARTVTITPLTLKDLCASCNCKPVEIWTTLGEHVREWTKRRQGLLEEAVELLETIEAEEEVFKTIPRK